MTRTLALSAALTVLAGAPSTAQTAAEPPLLEVGDEAMMVEPFAVSVDELEDTDILGVDGEKIGEVDEVLMTAEGEITAVSAEVGGFLGVGDKEVVLELTQLTQGADGLTVDMTEDHLEALPAWDD